MEGFVDLGKYTPENQEKTMGDHGLVVMFQLFQGSWVQAIACFLSKNACPGDILGKILLEAVLLLEGAGFYVDAIVTDGATWNRTMWRSFGLDIENNDTSCIHPSEAANKDSATRRLWFISDFPHLIKCLRNFVLSTKSFKIPEGKVDIKHWEAVASADESDNTMGLRLCSKFSWLHLRLNNLLKMNVALAFQFFGNSVKSAMETLKEHYKNIKKNKLQDADATIAFIDRINKLIDVMNSRTSKEAMWKNDSVQKKILQDFLDYLDEWEKVADPKKFISTSTLCGLRVTIKATLEIHEFLCQKMGFYFLMTDRLNQDALEHFFGYLRSSGGLSNHPEPTQFAQLFRLLSIYSLKKPPKGSNVTGGEILRSLMTSKDLTPQDSGTEVKKNFILMLDDILEQDLFYDNLERVNLDVENVDSTVSLFSLGYVAGYVARKAKSRWAKNCSCCHATLVGDGTLPSDLLIHFKTYGYLTYPSKLLVTLLYSLEKIVLSVLKEGLQRNVLFQVIEKLDESFEPTRVGCCEIQHSHQLTVDIIYFYVTMRMYFASRVYKRGVNNRHKILNKEAKLT